jgi:hypothetical protein
VAAASIPHPGLVEGWFESVAGLRVSFPMWLSSFDGLRMREVVVEGL